MDSNFKINNSKQIAPKLPEGKNFLVWLSHDVDRTHKTFLHSIYYFIKERKMHHLKTLFSSDDPYWNFEKIIDIENSFGVKSTFFFLNEQMKASILKPKSFILAKGRYKIANPKIKDVIQTLHKKGETLE